MNPRRRKTIPKKLKCMVWDQHIGKQNGIGKCFVCQDNIDSKHFEVGHIISVKKGGTDTLDNLKPVCELCNKSSLRAMGTENMMDYKKKYHPAPIIIESINNNNISSLLHTTWKDSNGYCQLCDKQIKTTNNWKRHLKTKKHMNNENNIGKKKCMN